MIERYSSRRERLGGLLPGLLAGALGYDRIAGYFSSSILEIAGEAIETMAEGAVVRVICNSELDPLDVVTARAAKLAMFREWCAALPADITPPQRARLARLADLLGRGRLQVRVLPDRTFGLIHGKAGVITRADGRPIAFIGSANESRRAWQLNYELVWTDDSDDAIGWVRDEFDALWRHPDAVELAEAVVQDVVRLVRRVVIPDLPAWRQRPVTEGAAGATVELPIYRRENGLWAHQKTFVQLAFARHRQGGARLLLADQVGLGKTVQLALAAMLMALWGGGPVLALVPKSLLRQWQDELWQLLRLPSAIWTGRGWEDEQGVLHPATGPGDVRRCPRRVGLVSTGLITQGGAIVDDLLALRYECVILDEAHRARRKNLGPTRRNERADPNNLLDFLRRIAPQTVSLLLASATPVQLDPIEAWDLLDALSQGNDTVLGSRFSRWRTRPRDGVALVLGQQDPPADLAEAWEWVRDPLPPADEQRDFDILRRSLGLAASTAAATPEALHRLGGPDQARLRGLTERFFQQHHPYIRHIVRRTRAYLETTIDPHTNEPYLTPVRVRLFGEGDDDAVPLPTYLRDAYQAAEEFCDEVGRRPKMSSGFLRTILLRRVGSTIVAGRLTGQKMLGPLPSDDDDDDDDDDETPRSALYPLTEIEREKLERFLRLLDASTLDDPKFRIVEEVLLRGAGGAESWLARGCIVFSQFHDSAAWVAEHLSARLPDEDVALYGGAARSGLFRAGTFVRLDRETIKRKVTERTVRLLVGTDAASEGLNLQTIGTLINLDLPWNPTRLEQRKGRIQRIGQVRDEVWVYNLRYRDSVEDRVHQLLSQRLQAIHSLFGQLPDTLEDAWVAVASHDEERARQIIDAVPTANPFELRYDRIEAVDWESVATVLDDQARQVALSRGW